MPHPCLWSLCPWSYHESTSYTKFPTELQPQSAELHVGTACRAGQCLFFPQAASLHEHLCSSQTCAVSSAGISFPWGQAWNEDHLPRNWHRCIYPRERSRKSAAGSELAREPSEKALKWIPQLQWPQGDWWEQAGQDVFSRELCQGLSMPQRRLYWLQIPEALQQLCRWRGVSNSSQELPEQFFTPTPHFS